MRNVFVCFFIMTLCMLASGKAIGQKKPKDFTEYIPTENINKKKDFNRKKHAPKRKNIRFIIKNNTKGILYGNPCMIEETRRMGFEYAVQTKGIPGSLGFFRRNWNNLITKLQLTFTRTPFWKLILRTRVKDCREKTGDLVG